MYVSARGLVHVHANAHEAQRKGKRFIRVRITGNCVFLMWVPGTELEFSTREF